MDTKKNIRKKEAKNKLKVVYISSPVKFKTSASRFRALVQELTGRDSDITRYDAINDFEVPTTSTTQGGSVYENPKPLGLAQQELFRTDSESFLDDVFSPEMLDQLAGVFSQHEAT